MDVPCVLPMFTLVAVTIFTNLSMIIRLFKVKSSSFGAGLMFTLIGITNVACCIFLSIRLVPQSTSMPPILLWTLLSFSMISFFLQIGFNVALAGLRYQVVRNAIDYHTSEARKKLEKKVSCGMIALSCLLGILFTSMRVVFNNLWFVSIPIAISRIIGYMLLTVLYVKLYFAMKSNAQAVSTGSAEGDQSIANRSLIKRRMRQLEHSKKFFIGITSSFFVLNLPTMVLFFIANEFPNCATWKGILTQIAVGLSCINMLFDSIWYFYLERQSTKS